MLTLEQRCKLATDCLPNAPYRKHLLDLHAELLDALKADAELAALRKDAERWAFFTRHASLGFHGSPTWRAVIGFPVIDHEDQTIAAIVDRAIDAARGQP